MKKAELKVVKRFIKEKVLILEAKGCLFRIFKVGPNFICVRSNGNVILDKHWQSKTNQKQKFKLKDFLGGMYIEEVKKDVKAGIFQTCDLNNVLNS